MFRLLSTFVTGNPLVSMMARWRVPRVSTG